MLGLPCGTVSPDRKMSAWALLWEAGAGYLLTPGLGLGTKFGPEVQRCEIHRHG